MKLLYNFISFIPSGWLLNQFYFSSNKSSASSSTDNSVRAHSAALEDVNESIVNTGTGKLNYSYSAPVTINNPDALEYLQANQAFLGETFSTALNLINNQSAKAFDAVADRNLTSETTLDIDQSTLDTVKVVAGIIVVGLVAYKVMK